MALGLRSSTVVVWDMLEACVPDQGGVAVLVMTLVCDDGGWSRCGVARQGWG